MSIVGEDPGNDIDFECEDENSSDGDSSDKSVEEIDNVSPLKKKSQAKSKKSQSVVVPKKG